VGIEENVFQIGKSITYNAVPWLDETAAAALRLCERGLEPALSLAGAVRSVGSFALDVINPTREDECRVRQHLEGRVGQLALIGSYDDLDDEIDLVAAVRTADSLWRSGIVDAGTIVAVRPLVHREPIKERLNLQQSAELLHIALDDEHKVASIKGTPEDPVQIHGRRPTTATVYEAIYRADSEVDNFIRDYLNERWDGDEDTAPRYRTLLTASPELSAQLRGIRLQDVANGGVAVLATIRKGYKSYWLPIERAPVVSAQAQKEIQEVVSGELELDFELPKSERFKRSGDDSAAKRQARERQIALAEG
jgi:hypothetical protein